MLIVRFVVLAFDGEHPDPVVLHERGGDLILCAQGIGRAYPDVRASRLERLGEIGGLRRHVQARRDADALEGAVTLEAFLDLPEHRHGGFSPLDFEFALVGEFNIPDIVFHCASFVICPRPFAGFSLCRFFPM